MQFIQHDPGMGEKVRHHIVERIDKDEDGKDEYRCLCGERFSLSRKKYAKLIETNDATKLRMCGECMEAVAQRPRIKCMWERVVKDPPVPKIPPIKKTKLIKGKLLLGGDAVYDGVTFVKVKRKKA